MIGMIVAMAKLHKAMENIEQDIYDGFGVRVCVPLDVFCVDTSEEFEKVKKSIEESQAYYYLYRKHGKGFEGLVVRTTKDDKDICEIQFFDRGVN